MMHLLPAVPLIRSQMRLYSCLYPIYPLHKEAGYAVEMVETPPDVCGGTSRLTIYPEAAHDAWSTTYANPALYEWLLSGHR